MFHTGRCGSTVLSKMLDLHSQIQWGGEIFEPYMRKDHGEFGLEFVKSKLITSCNLKVSKIYGFETKYLPQQHLHYSCINTTIENYIEVLNDSNFSDFIVLHRKNYLRRTISVQVGRQNKVWHTARKAGLPFQIELDTSCVDVGAEQMGMLNLFECIDQNFEILTGLLSQSRTLLLSYEDDILPDPNKAYTKVCDFLNIPVEPLEVPLSRTNPFSYEEMVSNFEEVVVYLKNSKYEWMLDQ